MSTTKVTYCKPKKNLANCINKLYIKTSLRKFEQLANNYIANLVHDTDFVKAASSLTDNECENFELAPVERDRFRSGVHMAVKEAMTVYFEHLNGLTNTASVIITINAKKLEKAFSLYCSGSFRRRGLLQKFGDKLTLLLAPEEGEQRKGDYNVVIECQYDQVKETPQVITYHTHRNCDNWITRTIYKNTKKLVDLINEKLETTYEEQNK